MGACSECEKVRESAKAAGHRSADGVCYDHAGVNWNEYLASLPEDEQRQILELADKIEPGPSPIGEEG